jgi:MFS family permease
MICWGIISGATAAVQSYGGLIAIRFLLGFVEAAYFPGVLFFLSSWYTRKELALRTAMLYSGSLISGAFSGLITAGITSGLDGAKGLRAWYVSTHCYIFPFTYSCTGDGCSSLKAPLRLLLHSSRSLSSQISLVLRPGSLMKSASSQSGDSKRTLAKTIGKAALNNPSGTASNSPARTSRHGF